MKKYLYTFVLVFVFNSMVFCYQDYPVKEIEADFSFSIIDAATAKEAVSLVWDFNLNDSLIIISDLRGDDLVCYTKTGTFVKRIGRSGQGPGEFDEIRQVYRIPEYIGVDDFGNKRLQIISLDGEMIKHFPYTKHTISDGIKHQASVKSRL